MGISVVASLKCDEPTCAAMATGLLRMETGKHFSIDLPEGWAVVQPHKIEWHGEMGWRIQAFCPEHADLHRIAPTKEVDSTEIV
jgi:hypothetical protein